MLRRVPGSMGTRQSLSDLIEGRLSSPDGHAELVWLATRPIVEEALQLLRRLGISGGRAAAIFLTILSFCASAVIGGWSVPMWVSPVASAVASANAGGIAFGLLAAMAVSTGGMPAPCR